MKTLYILLVTILTGLAGSLQGQTKAEIKAQKAEKQEQEFQKTLQLTESKQFQVKINRVFPSDGFDASRFNPRGHIIINDSIASGELPFFGRAFNVPYGKGGGIEFNAPMEELSAKVKTKKKEKTILWKFTVPGENDVFQIQLDISYSGSCVVSVNSNNRVQISYSGMIEPLSGNKN